MYLGAKRRYINTLPFLSFTFFGSPSLIRSGIFKSFIISCALTTLRLLVSGDDDDDYGCCCACLQTSVA